MAKSRRVSRAERREFVQAWLQCVPPPRTEPSSNTGGSTSTNPESNRNGPLLPVQVNAVSSSQHAERDIDSEICAGVRDMSLSRHPPPPAPEAAQISEAMPEPSQGPQQLAPAEPSAVHSLTTRLAQMPGDLVEDLNNAGPSGNQVGDPNLLQCALCPFTSPSHGPMMQHRLEHFDNPPPVADRRVRGLQRRINRPNYLNPRQMLRQRIQCLYCSYASIHPHKVRRHETIHSKRTVHYEDLDGKLPDRIMDPRMEDD